ncbi:ATP-binding protein [Paenibacillus maysiensis]|uniref:ATP-binding protein n=1 Tax=Paenibacillus maysiensis TaxID=1155954 RepID=UPI0004AF34AE|nr:sensor histidine kinase [Paenibacillus maysiensis]
MITSALYEEIGKRAMTVANTLAVDAQVRDALEQTGTTELRSQINEAVKPVQTSSGADFITIADRHLIRQWHVNPERIGQPMTDPLNNKVLQGQSFVTESTGSLGPSLRAKAPIYDEKDKVIGLVSVGFLMTDVEQNIRTYTYAWLWFMVGALVIGIIGSLLISQRVRRELHGLEPVEIGRLYQEKQAILESIGEGIIAVNSSGQVTLANPQAVRLLGLSPETSIYGCELRHLPGAAGELADILVGDPLLENAMVEPGQEQGTFNEEIEAQQRVVVVSRVPIHDRSGQRIGTVASLRDKTELLRMTRQLTEVKDYAEVLRSQTHEYANRLYLISGLIQLECYDEAVDFITRESEGYRLHRPDTSAHLPDSVIASLLIGKKKQALEKGIVLHSHISGAFSSLPPAPEWRLLAAMSGNLLDNAMEAAAIRFSSRPDGQVWFRLEETAEGITVEVADNGPGIPEAIQEKLFVKGASTKTEAGHGYGLALVQEYVDQMGSSIEVHERVGGGTVFKIRIPLNGPSSA